jgi:hypothetical protein
VPAVPRKVHSPHSACVRLDRLKIPSPATKPTTRRTDAPISQEQGLHTGLVA